MSIGICVDKVQEVKNHIVTNASALMDSALRNALAIGFVFGVDMDRFEESVAVMRQYVNDMDEAEFIHVSMTKNSKVFTHEVYEKGLRHYLEVVGGGDELRVNVTSLRGGKA